MNRLTYFEKVILPIVNEYLNSEIKENDLTLYLPIEGNDDNRIFCERVIGTIKNLNNFYENNIVYTVQDDGQNILYLLLR